MLMFEAVATGAFLIVAVSALCSRLFYGAAAACVCAVAGLAYIAGDVLLPGPPPGLLLPLAGYVHVAAALAYGGHVGIGWRRVRGLERIGLAALAVLGLWFAVAAGGVLAAQAITPAVMLAVLFGALAYVLAGALRYRRAEQLMQEAFSGERTLRWDYIDARNAGGGHFVRIRLAHGDEQVLAGLDEPGAFVSIAGRYNGTPITVRAYRDDAAPPLMTVIADSRDFTTGDRA